MAISKEEAVNLVNEYHKVVQKNGDITRGLVEKLKSPNMDFTAKEVRLATQLINQNLDLLEGLTRVISTLMPDLMLDD